MADLADLAADLKRTVLHALHLDRKGRMVPFGGYHMPVQYEGVMAEHRWTREHAGLFDVSHMGPAFLVLDQKTDDPEADHAAVAALVEPLVCGDIRGLKPGQLRYTLLMNEAGGIDDDLMVGRPADPAWAGSLYIVVNAGTKEADFARIAEAAAGRATLNRADDGGLMALQGPEAAAVLETLIPGVSQLAFMTYTSFGWGSGKVVVSRSGYTGEDGFEILVADDASALWSRLLEDERVRPIGLGARDSLRLEAGLPLYGHDLDETVSPVEANLNFAVSKRRREAADFPGAARVLAEWPKQVARVRVGLTVTGAPAREGAEIALPEGDVVGSVTSGGFGPSVNGAVAMGFVPPEHSAPGTPLQVIVRGRRQPAVVTPLPFVSHRYVRKA